MNEKYSLSIYSFCRALLYPFFIFLLLTADASAADAQQLPASRVLLNHGWKFYRYPPGVVPDSLIYDARPVMEVEKDDKPADSKPTEAVITLQRDDVLKPWILPSGNRFIKDPQKRYQRPVGNPGSNFPFVQQNFDDSNWENINLPHDWAIKGPFYKENNAVIGGGMGRLPVQGVAWYRRQFTVPAADKGKSVFLEVEGAMSYAMVWINGKLAGGWPMGYTSWQLDLTPYINAGGINQLAIRLDNPPASSRWYPGAGIYRNIWLVTSQPVHVAQWGTAVSTTRSTAAWADLNVSVTVDNDQTIAAEVKLLTQIYELDAAGKKAAMPVAACKQQTVHITGRGSQTVHSSVKITRPRLWGPYPTQKPNRYIAVTKVFAGNKITDVAEQPFGIREVVFDADKGVLVNGEKIVIKGVNQHHDLGALGAAFNAHAAKRQLDMLREVGCNAIRMSHNPPAPELLELTDQMGFLVFDEIFDCWERKKNPLDFHLIFPDWHEQDLRALIRRDRNHPSVIIWGVGNEVGEQYTDVQGAQVAKRLYDIAREEDVTRPVTTAMNYAKPDMPLPGVFDIISLNYQGEGIRWGGAYTGLKGIITPPMFPAFHTKYPEKLIISTENASALSSRGEYLFPVFEGNSAPVKEGAGGDSARGQVSAYELYSVAFGASPDKVFASLDQHPYVAGGFVWTGWDHLGEPTPYYNSKSSYCGLIDLAGFKKDRFYLYQAYWRPDFPMVHILPHWNWPERKGLVTPVHVFTSGDEGELFLNGVSMGRKKKGQYEYRLRWDNITYIPGELKVIAYKNGKKWAEDKVVTAGAAYQLNAAADCIALKANGEDLAFISIEVCDNDGIPVRNASHSIRLSIEGPGEIVATDNGDPASLQSFADLTRKAFNGSCLAIIRTKAGKTGIIKLKAETDGLKTAVVNIKVMGM